MIERGVPPATHAEYPGDVKLYTCVTRQMGVTEDTRRVAHAAARVLLPFCVALSWHEPAARNDTVKS